MIDISCQQPSKTRFWKVCLCKSRHAGQSTWFKAFITIGNYNGHVGLGVKDSEEIATTICGAIILAKLSIVPVWPGYYGNNIDKPHAVPCRVTATVALCWCASSLPPGHWHRLRPCPNGLLHLGQGLHCHPEQHHQATFGATSKTSTISPLTSRKRLFSQSPFQEFTNHLVKTQTTVTVQRIRALAVATCI